MLEKSPKSESGCWLGLHSSEGWAGAGEAASTVVHPRGWQVGAAGGGRPQFVPRGPPNRTACTSSQYGSCFPQSQQRGGHSVLCAPSSKVTHSQCLQFPTGYIGVPCSLWERTAQDMNSGRKVSPEAILGAHGLEVNYIGGNSESSVSASRLAKAKTELRVWILELENLIPWELMMLRV